MAENLQPNLKVSKPSKAEKPLKCDGFINPKTGRLVKMGSRTWINLIKKGLISVDDIEIPKDENIIEEFEEIPEEELEQKIKKINEELPIGTQAVRGRGKYANKIVKRSKTPSIQEITKNTVKKATKAVLNNIDELTEEIYSDYDDMSERLEKMIMEEMMNK